MFDLIGFWSAVTLITAPVVALVWKMLEMFINSEVRAVTDNKCSWTPLTDWWQRTYNSLYRADLEFFVFIAAFIVIICEVILFVAICTAVDCETGVAIPPLQLVSELCMFLAPVMGYVGIASIIVFVQRKVFRPMLKKAYAVKLKVESL